MVTNLQRIMNIGYFVALDPRGLDSPYGVRTSEAKESPKLAKNLNGKLPFDIPVQAYANEKEVPKDFLIQNPREIPSRIWGQHDATEQNAFVLPVIDMCLLMQQPEDSDGAKKVIEEIGKACEEWGYFQAYNHGVPESLLDGLLEAIAEFFSLPLDEKNVYAIKPEGTEGYGRLGKNLPTRHWSDMMRHTVRPKLSPEEVEKRIPAKPSQYRVLIEEYTQEVEKFLEVVWAALTTYLDLQTTTLQKSQEQDCQMIIRVNYYPKCPEPEKVVGVPAHQDFGSITVLLEDQVGGLQVSNPNTGDSVWLDITPMKGSLLVNIGKQVEHLSNGRLKAMLHRALVNRKDQRTSLAAFIHPGPECTIKPIQELLDRSQEAPRFSQLRFGDYVTNYTADTLSGISPDARYEIHPKQA